MKIALLGYGKMGRMVEAAALARGHTIAARIDSSTKDKSVALKGCDLCIDFSRPETALDHIKVAAAAGKNIVVGTTGWYDALPEAKKHIQQAGIGLLYSPNFSIGVQFFLKIAEEAARLITNNSDYDAAILEKHHKEKLDSPSGTALSLARSAAAFDREIPISSMRCGSICGEHSLIFDSPCDTIALTHTARSREGFARGAVTAAEWLAGKKGFFTLQEMLGL